MLIAWSKCGVMGDGSDHETRHTYTVRHTVVTLDINIHLTV